MASSVPYTGTQDVAPQQGFLPAAHEDTPVAAFGGATAGALTHMGEVAQGVGKELFDRAYAFQELGQQNKADSASQDVFAKQTDRYIQFQQLKGAERTPEAFAQYRQDLVKLRNDGAEGLDSPYAKSQYLRDTRRNESMMLWHGAVLGAQGLDEATGAALTGKMNAAGDALSTVNAKGPELERGIAEIAQTGAELVHHKTGFAPGTQENANLAAPAISSQVGKIVLARSDADPVEGKSFAETMHDRKLLSQEDYDKLKPVLEARVLNKTGAEIARGVLSGYDPADKKNDIDVEAQARAAANKKDPGNKDLSDQAAIKALTLKDHIDDLKFKSEKQDRDILFQSIDGTNSKDGKVPVSLEEAEANGGPDWKIRYDRLTQPSQYKVQEIIRRNQELGGVVHNPKGDLTYYKMMQIGVNRNTTSTPQELDDLANADLLKAPYDTLTRDQRQSLLKVQGEVVNQTVQDPNMTHALTLGSVQGLLKQAGIDKASNPDEYNKFQTAYHDAIVGYGLGAERSVKNDGELTDIATGLINKQSGAWFAGLRHINTAQPYQSIIDTSKSAERLGRSMFRQQFGREPDLESEADKKVTNDLAMRQIYKTYGQQSKPIAGKSTGQASP